MVLVVSSNSGFSLHKKTIVIWGCHKWKSTSRRTRISSASWRIQHEGFFVAVRSASPDGVPGGEPEVLVPRAMLSPLEGVRRDGGLRQVSHPIAAGLEEQEHVLAISDPGSTEAHAAAQPLDA